MDILTNKVSEVRVDDFIKYLKANRVGTQPWLTNAATNVSESYQNLRYDLKRNKTLWSYSQHCERMAFFYYDLASFYYKLYEKEKFGLLSVKFLLEKCSIMIDEIPEIAFLTDMQELKTEVNSILTQINELVESLEKNQRSLKKQKVLKTEADNTSMQYVEKGILIGNFEDDKEFVKYWNKCSQDKSNQLKQVQNIKILKIIYFLEEIITEQKSQEKYNQALSNTLGEAYGLANCLKLKKSYQHNASNITLGESEFDKIGSNDFKDQVEAINAREIPLNKLKLIEMKRYIEEELQIKLSDLDNREVEVKYKQILCENWTLEVKDTLKDLRKNQNRMAVLDIYTSLDSVKSFETMCNPFNWEKEKKIYALLSEQTDLLTHEEMADLLTDFKKECLETVLNSIDSVSIEAEFLEAFRKFISTCESPRTTLNALQVINYSENKLSLDNFLQIILDHDSSYNGSELLVLKRMAKKLKGETCKQILKSVIDAISQYIIKIELITSDRKLILVKGGVIVMSEIMPELETEMQDDTTIEEARFVGDVVRIDINFENGLWHGKNVVVDALLLQVRGSVTWDLSGANSDHKYDVGAATNSTGEGQIGLDGYPGESAGNVTIAAVQIENLENLTIIANGGAGSSGQNGGPGNDGENGHGLNETEFMSTFFVGERGLFSNLLGFKTKEAYRLYDNGNNMVVLRKKHWCSSVNRYVDGTTSMQNWLTCSLYKNLWLPHFNILLLHRGTNGSRGGKGGDGGRGGAGGYSGNIWVGSPITNRQYDVNASTKQGDDGADGHVGRYGNPGKKAGDMGFACGGFKKQPLCYINGNYEIKYYNSRSQWDNDVSDGNPDHRMWCAYHNKYAAIVTRKGYNDDAIKEYANQQNENLSKISQHAQAIRKKNLALSRILSSYSEFLSSFNKHNLNNKWIAIRKEVQQALQEIDDNKNKQANKEFKVTKNLTYEDLNQKSYFFEINEEFVKCAENVEKLNNEKKINLQEKMRNNLTSIDSWMKLVPVWLDRNELRDLIKGYKYVKNRLLQEERQLKTGMESKVLQLEHKFNRKYISATLREVSNKLDTSMDSLGITITLSNESVVRCLQMVKTQDSEMKHQILGSLDFLFCDTNNGSNCNLKLCLDNELEIGFNDSIALKYSYRRFILEGEIGEKKGILYEYYQDYQLFIKNQQLLKDNYFSLFQNELRTPKNARIMNLWNESLTNMDLRLEVEDLISKDQHLKYLFEQSIKQYELRYDWDKCYTDSNVLNEFKKSFEKFGIMYGWCREFVAHLYDTNIQVFAEDESVKFLLLDNHNPVANKIVSFLFKNNQFVRLDLNENLQKLEIERSKKDRLYAKILDEVESFTSLKDADEYYDSEQYKQYFITENQMEKLVKDPKVFNEESIIFEILKYFPDRHRNELKLALEKMSSRHLNANQILFYLKKAFNTEEGQVSHKELIHLLYLIVQFLADGRKELNIFAWIFCSCPQTDWIREFMIVQFENYFGKILPNKPIWVEYLAKVNNKDILILLSEKLNELRSNELMSEDNLEEILRLLGNTTIVEMNVLVKLSVSEWVYALKEMYWTSQLKTLINWPKEELSKATYYLLSIENTCGLLFVEKLLACLVESKDLFNPTNTFSPENLTHFFWNFYCHQQDLTIHNIQDVLKIEIENLTKLSLNTEDDQEHEERNITKLIELIDGNGNTSWNIQQNLPLIKDYITQVYTPDVFLVSGKSVWDFIDSDVQAWVKNAQKGETFKQDQKIVELLEIIDQSIKLIKGFKLRDTQKLTILSLLLNNSNSLAQVATGEGKSFIVVALAIIRVFQGATVDIITSSSVLAKRDAEENAKIFNLFGINVSHNCDEKIDKRKETYSKNQVIYGDLSNFQRDYLLDRFYEKNIFGDRKFQTVIVDEVDSMLLDKGNNVLYLTHDLVDFDKLESVYIFIWQQIKDASINLQTMEHKLDSKIIKEEIIKQLYMTINEDDISALDQNLTKQQVDMIWEKLVDASVITSAGRLIVRDLDSKLTRAITGEFFKYKKRLNYLLRECIDEVRFIDIPNYIKPFVEYHLDAWIQSAVSAFYMEEGHDYVVDSNRNGGEGSINPNIIILDKDTGTDQSTSQWDKGLHQFLQLKHGCRISLQSLKAVFISNVTYFKKYNKLYGLSGTLGSQMEREMLKEIHSVDYIDIPTFKIKQFSEYTPILCCGDRNWLQIICNEAEFIANSKQRSVLIICETVKDVDAINNVFKNRNLGNVFTYKRDYEKFAYNSSENELPPGYIIIATNLAGRGADIKITSELKIAGGLHIILAYLPTNVRIEQQAFGRSARKGDKGSGQFIVKYEGRGQSNYVKFLKIKKQRDSEELKRLSELKSFYYNQIKLEENCFASFTTVYIKLKKLLELQPSDLKSILLKSCLNSWAFWLEKSSEMFGNLADEQNKRSINGSLTQFIQDFERLLVEGENISNFRENDLDNQIIIPHLTPESSAYCFKWVENDPIQMTKLGLIYCRLKSYGRAIEVFDKVIAMEPNWSEASRYYKIYCLLQNNSMDQQVLKKELIKCERLFEKREIQVLHHSNMVGVLKKRDHSLSQIDAYEAQQENRAEIYRYFCRAIKDINGHMLTANMFENGNVSADVAEVVFYRLLDKGILKKHTINHIEDDDLNKLCTKNGLSKYLMQNFLSTYLNQNFDLHTFKQKLKATLPLPSKENFWDSLVTQGAITDVELYIMVKNETLQDEDPFFDLYTATENLENYSLESDETTILFNTSEVNNLANYTVFKEDEFVKKVGVDKVSILRMRNQLQTVKKAKIDVAKLKTASFNSFDMLQITDFNLINVEHTEGMLIIKELMELNILKLEGNDCYKLSIKCEQINEIELYTSKVYENIVKKLLKLKFLYRNELEKIQLQLEMKASPLEINLISNPDSIILAELFDLKIITGATVSKQSIHDGKINEEMVHNALSEHLRAENSVEKKCCRYGMHLTNEIITEVLSILDNSKSTLLCFDKFNSELVSIEENIFVNKKDMEEDLQLFSLNGLDQKLNLVKKPQNFWSSILVFSISIAQIYIGTVLKLFSTGTWRQYGIDLIHEGINDMLFSLHSIFSNSFNFDSYLTYKIVNLTTNFLTLRYSNGISLVKKVLEFAANIFGLYAETYKSGRQKIDDSKFNKLKSSDTIGIKEIRNVKDQTLSKLADNFDEQGIDSFIESEINQFCKNVLKRALTGVDVATTSHRIQSTIRKLIGSYDENDKFKANKFIKKLCKSSSEEVKKKFEIKIKEVGFKINVKIREKCGHHDSGFIQISKAISQLIKKINYDEQIISIETLVNNVLDELNTAILDELKVAVFEKMKSKNRQPKQRNSTVNDDLLYEQIITDLSNELQILVKNEVDKQFNDTIFKEGGEYLASFAKKMMRKKFDSSGSYNSTINNLNSADIQKWKNSFKKNDRQDVLNEPKSHKYLRKWFLRNKSPTLLANMIREEVYLDIDCIDICAKAIHIILRKYGVEFEGLMIVAKDQSDLIKKIKTADDSQSTVFLRFQFKNNVFCLNESFAGVNETQERKSLYDALVAAFPDIKNTLPISIFIEDITSCIETNPIMQDYIQNKWHLVPTPFEMIKEDDDHLYKKIEYMHSKNGNN